MCVPCQIKMFTSSPSLTCKSQLSYYLAKKKKKKELSVNRKLIYKLLESFFNPYIFSSEDNL